MSPCERSRRSRVALALVCVVGVALAAACAPRAPLPQAPQAAPPDFPFDVYRQAAAAGQAVYRLVPGRSQVIIRVGRAGSLARLGHDHIVSSGAVGGFVVLRSSQGGGRADLYLPVASLEVDDPQLREQSGLDASVPAEDIEATRHNMLNKVLDAEAHPFVRLQVADAAPVDGRGSVPVAITLNGVRRSTSVPVVIERDAERLRVTGRFTIRQTDFQITPYSILGGAVRVADALEIRFELEAQRR